MAARASETPATLIGCPFPNFPVRTRAANAAVIMSRSRGGTTALKIVVLGEGKYLLVGREEEASDRLRYSIVYRDVED